MKLSVNVKKYISLKKKLDKINETNLQDNIQDELEDLYFDLDDEEIITLELKGFI